MKPLILLVIAAILLSALLVPAVRLTQAQSATITFAVIGDYGMNNTAELNVANMVSTWNPDLILATGDDYYTPAGGTGTGKYDLSTGKYYCRFLKDAAAGASCAASGMDPTTNRFFPSLGNHDYSDSGLSIYESYFTLPGSGFSSSSGNERYYDFVWGPVHFFIINSNSQEPDGITSSSAQALWLQSRLAASTAPWQVVVDHHPPYSSGASHGSTPSLQWPYAAWGADMLLSGHDHTYERIVRDGIVYFVNGAGGASLYSFTTPVTGSAFRYNTNYGAMRITASSTAMDIEFLSIDAGGTLRDTYHLPAGTPTATPTATSTPTGQQTVSFQNGVSPSAAYAGMDDTYFSQAAPGTNFGAAAAILVDGDDPAGSGSDLSTLLRWDVRDIPAGSTLQSASLALNVFNPSANSYPIYEMKQGWVESESNWNVYAAGQSWGAAGAQGTLDRGATVLGSLAPAANGLYTLNLNASGLALVQSWVDNPANNHGLIVASSSNTDGVDMDSSEAAGAANRPKLTLRYLPPVAAPTNTPTFTPVPPTPTFTPLPPTPTFTPTGTPVAPTPTFTPEPPTPTFTPEPPTPTFTPLPADVLYVSSSTGGTAAGVSFADEDILSYTFSTAAWAMVFDGSDVGLGGTDVDGFSLLSNGNILLSFDSAVTVTGLGSVADSDIVRFIPTSTGNTTAGSFQWYFDGSDVGLSTNNEDIDAISFTPDGKLLVSTLGGFSVPAVSGEDEDLLAFTATSPGSTTAGTWALYFDGSDMGLSESSSEDINGAWIDSLTGKIYLTTLGNFSVTGLSGDASDIFICTPGSTGATTTCTYGPGLYWDGSVRGFSGEDVDGFEVVR